MPRGKKGKGEMGGGGGGQRRGDGREGVERERGREGREREQYTLTHFTQSAFISVRDEASLIALHHVTIPNHDVMRV